MSPAWENETALALRAVTEGGRIAQQRTHHLTTRTKESVRDIVTAVDVAVEQYIEGVLAPSSYRVLGEEGGGKSAFPLVDEAPVWVVDPIDGTVNYVNGLPHFAVSVGLCHKDQFLAGAVCMPDAGELYTTYDKRAVRNGKPIAHVHAAPETSLVAASFSGDRGDPALRDAQYRVFGAINDSTLGCLRLGSSAVNICYTAANRLQAAYGLRAKIWDVAGGLAVASRSGCRVHVTPTAGGRVDYFVGSSDTVDMIRALCISNGLTE